ncbi:hypothetical protein L2E82_22325 [Cichorium intybus]|uniref:Uncharacterized protein n=1 Tax=Cichorium intybus TaxID=13427 RepID=A0ACB9DXJ0_CICIN|nr:hypothetical protein L2E82_22325 [Cichorium intybus]
MGHVPHFFHLPHFTTAPSSFFHLPDDKAALQKELVLPIREDESIPVSFPINLRLTFPFPPPSPPQRNLPFNPIIDSEEWKILPSARVFVVVIGGVGERSMVFEAEARVLLVVQGKKRIR